MSVIHDGSESRMRDRFVIELERKDAEIRRLTIRHDIEKRRADFYQERFHRLRHETQS